MELAQVSSRHRGPVRNLTHDVAWYQAMFRLAAANGQSTYDGPVDGHLDRDLVAAVRELQLANGLAIDPAAPAWRRRLMTSPPGGFEPFGVMAGSSSASHDALLTAAGEQGQSLRIIAGSARPFYRHSLSKDPTLGFAGLQWVGRDGAIVTDNAALEIMRAADRTSAEAMRAAFADHARAADAVEATQQAGESAAEGSVATGLVLRGSLGPAGGADNFPDDIARAKLVLRRLRYGRPGRYRAYARYGGTIDGEASAAFWTVLAATLRHFRGYPDPVEERNAPPEPLIEPGDPVWSSLIAGADLPEAPRLRWLADCPRPYLAMGAEWSELDALPSIPVDYVAPKLREALKRWFAQARDRYGLALRVMAPGRFAMPTLSEVARERVAIGHTVFAGFGTFEWLDGNGQRQSTDDPMLAALRLDERIDFFAARIKAAEGTGLVLMPGTGDPTVTLAQLDVDHMMALAIEKIGASAFAHGLLLKLKRAYLGWIIVVFHIRANLTRTARAALLEAMVLHTWQSGDKDFNLWYQNWISGGRANSILRDAFDTKMKGWDRPPKDFPIDDVAPVLRLDDDRGYKSAKEELKLSPIATIGGDINLDLSGDKDAMKTLQKELARGKNVGTAIDLMLKVFVPPYGTAMRFVDVLAEIGDTDDIMTGAAVGGAGIAAGIKLGKILEAGLDAIAKRFPALRGTIELVKPYAARLTRSVTSLELKEVIKDRLNLRS